LPYTFCNFISRKGGIDLNPLILAHLVPDAIENGPNANLHVDFFVTLEAVSCTFFGSLFGVDVEEKCQVRRGEGYVWCAAPFVG
jgi:hypothetical protein